jgi:hypothetical protein
MELVVGQELAALKTSVNKVESRSACILALFQMSIEKQV